MRRFARELTLALGIAVLAAGVAAAKPKAPSNPPPRKLPPVPSLYGPEKAPFDDVLARMNRARRATVNSACGSTVAPWAYRGRRGRMNSLQAFRSEKLDEAWTRRFVATLMHAADWDSVKRFRSSTRNCGDSTYVPHVVVTLESNPSLYALLVFPKRQAVLFEDDRPLGSLQMGDRADSLFALVREALPREPGLEVMPAFMPQRARAEADTSLAYGDTLKVETLPEVIHRALPQYPESARLAQVQGTVFLQALIGRQGQICDVFVRNAIPGLEDSALDAVWQWRFKPASHDGEPVAVWVLVPVTFRLN